MAINIALTKLTGTPWSYVCSDCQ